MFLFVFVFYHVWMESNKLNWTELNIVCCLKAMRWRGTSDTSSARGTKTTTRGEARVRWGTMLAGGSSGVITPTSTGATTSGEASTRTAWRGGNGKAGTLCVSLRWSYARCIFDVVSFICFMHWFIYSMISWKQTSSRSITVWTQPGDSLRTENDGSNSWKRLRSSQGHARDDDDDWFICCLFAWDSCVCGVFNSGSVVAIHQFVLLACSMTHTEQSFDLLCQFNCHVIVVA